MKLAHFCPSMHGVRNRTAVFVCINLFALLLTWTLISIPPFLVAVVLVVVVCTEQLQFSPFAQ